MADSLRHKCTAAGQDQLLHFWDRLSEAEQTSLRGQIDSLDLDRVNRIYTRSVEGEKQFSHSASDAAGATAAIHPLPEEAFDSIVGAPDKEDTWRSVGMQAIANSQVGVLLMAGGQGTRLGSSAPKGCYDIGLPSHKSLFQLQAERIAKLQELAAKNSNVSQPPIITWYIMTSGPTRSATETFFREHAYFGLRSENVVFFEQGTLPCLTLDGKIILDAPANIAVAPDGNGGLYAALRSPLSHSDSSKTVLSDMEIRKIAYVHAYGVDNCLVRVADPVFVGFGISKGADCGVKVVRKTNPSESVGVVAMRGPQYSVVEYSEISKEQAERKDSKSGELAFRAANIANHFYTTAFLRSVETFEDQLAYHIARKKIPFVDANTAKTVKPDKPNGMKLELFVFDVFPFAKHFGVMEVERAEEFSPLKNAPGTGSDDPDTSRRDIFAQHKRFLQAAGAVVSEGIEVEVSPSVTYSGEGLESLKGKTIKKSGMAKSLQELDTLL